MGFFVLLCWRMKAFVVFALFVAFACAFESNLCSGFVRDGISSDIDVQSSTSAIKASWSGFTGEKILRYEWAVVSSKLAPESFSGNSCREMQGFRGHPDIFGWQNAGTSTSASATASLVDGEKYFIVVRATNALGQQFYSNSNGFIVDASFVEETEKIQVQTSQVEQPKQVKSFIFAQEECPINQLWKCNAGQVSVREKLKEYYGPPLFGIIAGFVAPVSTVVEDDDDDDDGGFIISGGGAFGIAVAITAFFCLLVLGIMFISAFGKEGGEFKTNVRRHEHVDEF